MSLGAGNLLLASAGDAGYNLTRSLRTRASASSYLNRTPASTTNQKTLTYSVWFKRGTLGTNQTLIEAYTGSGGQYTIMYMTSGDVIRILSAGTTELVTTQVFRDPSAWYHVVLAIDTTQATAANRVKLYVNGSQVTAFTTATYPALNDNTYFNRTTAPTYISESTSTGNAFPFDGYMTEINFVDGLQLTPSSFGSTNTLTGVWQPARYTGTYGTNGFYLPFTDNSALTTSSNVGLGKDFSGNGNYWVTNNISITAGVTYDSMTDVPTLTSATAANFAVLNPLTGSPNNASIVDGNLDITTPITGFGATNATIGISTGKFYWEVTCQSTQTPNPQAQVIGIRSVSATNANYIGQDAYGYSYRSIDGNKYNSGTGTAYGAAYTQGDVIGVAFDATAGTLTFYKNNVSQGVAFSSIPSSVWFPAFSDVSDSWQTRGTFNFGQRPFSYTPPTGFVALNCYNLPTSTIVKGNTVMDATLYTGTLVSNAITNAASFKPDLVWVKSRSAATDHKLTDSVRGVTKALISDTTGAETTDTQGLTAFGSAGFTVGTNTDYNNLAATYVAWQWQAGQGSSSSNTNGSITSTVSVNASAGFSVVTYTGTGANATVGHGLGVAPTFILIKQRSISGNWQVYHSATGNTQSSFLNSTATPSTSALYWNSTSPTSSVFSLGSAGDTNSSGATYVAYCWTPISGFSSIGSYVGNGSNDGVFVYTGFLPKWLLVKNTGQVNDWFVIDSAMNTYNVMGEYLFPNSSAVSNTFSWIDFLSNGFKIRSTGTGNNNSGITQIYAAFASNPFKNSLAR